MNFNDFLTEDVKNVKEQMKREDLLLFAKRRKECNRKAQEVVVELLDTVNPQRFLEVLELLNQEHINDVFEERSITKLCGYPICNETLGVIVKHQYKISTKLNKVYDITERKKFCSKGCFAAAKYIREQLPSSPLWVNDFEQKPKYILLNHKESTPHLGDEVTFDLPKVKLSDDNVKHLNNLHQQDEKNITQAEADSSQFDCNKTLTSEYNTYKDSVAPILSKTSIKKSVNENKERSFVEDTCKNTLNRKVVKESLGNDIVPASEEKEIIKDKGINDNVCEHKPMPQLLVPKEKVLSSVTERKVGEVKKRKERNNESERVQVKFTPEIVVQSVIEIIKGWISFETIKFIHGKEIMKKYESVATSGETIYTDDEKMKMISKYNELCRKLDLLEIHEELTDSTAEDRKLKPLPDYNELKKQSHKLEIKVNAFYAGETHIPTKDFELPSEESEEVNSLPTKDDQNLRSNASQVTFLPSLDKTDKNTMRRKVLLNNMQPQVSKILLQCKLSRINISSDLRSLVQTFSLRPDNIVFKPVQMNLICHIIIYIIAIKDATLTQLLETKFAKMYYNYILQAYQIDFSKFLAIITEVTDIEQFLQKSTQSR